MSKLRSISQFQDCLDQGFSWRLKEVANIKVAIRSNSTIAQKTIIRAGIPLLYAHWEGFVKQSSEFYLTYVSSLALNYGELDSCFVVFGAKKHLNSIINARRAKINIEAVDFFRSCSGVRANLALSNAINTESNLSSDVFANIATSIGVSTVAYVSYFKLIDESLLKRRNGIAHGEYLDINVSEFIALADEVINLLRMFKSDLENHASTCAFLTH